MEGENLFKKIEGIDLVLGTKAVGRISHVIERVLNGEEGIVDPANARKTTIGTFPIRSGTRLMLRLPQLLKVATSFVLTA